MYDVIKTLDDDKHDKYDKNDKQLKYDKWDENYKYTVSVSLTGERVGMRPN